MKKPNKLDKNSANIITMYTQDEMSVGAIAKTYDTYPTSINRFLKKNGVVLRTKKEAQLLALKKGRSKHPTAGKKRTDAEKLKISAGVSEAWSNISDEERQKRVEKSQELWYNMSDEEKANLQKKASVAIREAGQKGSKMERHVSTALIAAGYDVVVHRKTMLGNTKLELYIMLPGIKTVIAIDGIAHFFPIWGEESLKKKQRADREKTGSLLDHGYVLIRVKHMAKNITLKNKTEVADLVLKYVNQIKDEFPPKNKRYLEIEVK